MYLLIILGDNGWCGSELFDGYEELGFEVSGWCGFGLGLLWECYGMGGWVVGLLFLFWLLMGLCVCVCDVWVLVCMFVCLLVDVDLGRRGWFFL